MSHHQITSAVGNRGAPQQLARSYLSSDSLVKAHVRHRRGSYRMDAEPQPKHIVTGLGAALVQTVPQGSVGISSAGSSQQVRPCLPSLFATAVAQLQRQNERNEPQNLSRPELLRSTHGSHPPAEKHKASACLCPSTALKTGGTERERGMKGLKFKFVRG